MDTFIICYGFVTKRFRALVFQLSFLLVFTDGVVPPFFSGECSLKAAEEGRHAMTMNVGWQELYQAALLELRPDELRRRIDEAEKAIQQRIVDLSLKSATSREKHP